MSADIAGQTINMDGIADPTCLEIEGVPHSGVLLQFSNAFMSFDELQLEKAREALVAEMGSAAMVDVAGIASNFQRMVRIADGTGIPVESMGEEMDSLVEELNEAHGLNDYSSAANTRAAKKVL
ncbi:MAG: hypothetical protein GKR93_19070 [Gammaproteobacteria bacterium]|nr:hypothetical protein [Gammaproteobacteria bacterium]